MTLCNSCRKFDLRSFARDPDGLRGYRLEDLLAQAGRGCLFCLLLYAGLKDTISALIGKKDLWIHMKMYNSFEQKDLGFNRLRVHVGPQWQSFHENSIYDEPKQAVQFFIAADPQSEAAKKDVCGRYLGEDPKSDEQISALKEWLEECLRHPKCSLNMSGTIKIDATMTSLPTRCIYVGTETQTSKLEETEHQTGSYIILSHRWNSETETCKTTIRNYATRKKSLPVEFLPKTFQDAIWITRRLNVSYLWIDSICIIQEENDWKREAVKMAQYYQHSLITIAAAGGSEEHGLFPPFIRLPPYNIIELPYLNSRGKREGNFYIYQDANIDVKIAYGLYVSESDLLQRGWVFQEWLLSRRIVCYTRSGVFFLCQTDHPRNERFEKIEPAASESLAQFLLLKKDLTFQTTESLNNLWYKMVETYSKRHLKYPDVDRILALAGLAKEFKEALRQRYYKRQHPNQVGLVEYVSGLWLQDIHHGLLWEMSSDSIGGEGRIKGIPTWSWASRIGEVEWEDRADSIKNACEVVGLINKQGISLTIKNIEDRIRRAGEYDVDNMFTSLRIRCRMQPVYIRRRFSDEKEIEEARSTTGHAVGSELWRTACSPLTPTIISGWALIEDSALEAQLSLSEDTVVQALHISSTQVFGGIRLGYFWATHDVFNVLFIQNVGDGRRFERVGLGKLYGKEMSLEFRDAVEQEIELV